MKSTASSCTRDIDVAMHHFHGHTRLFNKERSRHLKICTTKGFETLSYECNQTIKVHVYLSALMYTISRTTITDTVVPVLISIQKEDGNDRHEKQGEISCLSQDLFEEPSLMSRSEINKFDKGNKLYWSFCFVIEAFNFCEA